MKNNLKEILIKRGINKKTLASETGLNYHLIDRICHHRYAKQIPKQYIERIATALKINIKDIVGNMYEN